MRRLAFVTAATLLGVLSGSAVLAGCGEEPRSIEITFRNATERRVVMLVLRPGDTAAETLARLPVLPATSEAGGTWRHDAAKPSGEEPSDGQWCEPLVTYVFLSPKDPTVTSRGVSQQTDPHLSIDELDEIDRLTTPCWEKRTGNEYTIHPSDETVP